MSRADRMMARLMGHAPRDAKWPRFQVEIPPEQADELMRLYRRTMGVNASAATRAGLLRTALLAWWESQDPEPDAPIEGTATEIIEPLDRYGALRPRADLPPGVSKAPVTDRGEPR